MSLPIIKYCPGTLAAGFETYSGTCLRKVFYGKSVNHILPMASPQKDEGTLEAFLENMKRIIDMEPRDKCCNCISFTLYSTANIESEDKLLKVHEDKLKNGEEDDEEDGDIFYETLEMDLYKLCNYLLSLKISVMNINERLKDFVVRIYLDISVISVINKFNEIHWLILLL